jgi:hypothetical protein
VLLALDAAPLVVSAHQAWVATTSGAIIVALVAGIVAALLATALVAAGGLWLRKRRRQRDFASLAGDYDIRRKLHHKLEPEFARIIVTDNLLRITYIDGEKTVVEGHIEMNEQLVRSGRGHYHDYRKTPDHLWGFWEIQVTPTGEILQHTTYANPQTHTAVVSGFVWEPRAPSNGS